MNCDFLAHSSCQARLLYAVSGLCSRAATVQPHAHNKLMPAGKIEEIEDAKVKGVFKIRTDHDEHTLYEVQNRSKDRVEAVFEFHDTANIRFELCEGTKLGVGGAESFVASVGPGATVGVVKLFTAVDGEPWKFDYHLAVRPADAPDWLE